ncbi:MAG: TonB-dependent receptor [Carboxylicivirga sp.]|jgi:TonB-linked SusC/RagA family outer membrane protein|nr:TonB-dependent receptor [Carboxylicivirga sp.]
MKKFNVVKPPAFWQGGKRTVRLMKISALLLFAGCLSISAAVNAQKNTVDLRVKDCSIINVLEQIQEQTGYRFAYSDQLSKSNQKVTLDVSNKNISEVLDVILEDMDYKYRITDDVIILLYDAVKVSENITAQQAITVSGRVIDAQGEPLPGVNVFEKSNPTNGVITGVDGSYSISIDDPNAIVVFSFIGFNDQEINIAGRSEVNVTLVEETTGLDEVVVVGYGTQKKANLTGAVVQVSGEQLAMRTETNVLNSLQGMMSGVSILRSTGDLGSNVQIQVRGRSSINDTPALVIIDGSPSTIEELGRLNSNDIENLSVLKDGSSAAIYGARAAGGVILVTTKTGEEGKLKVRINSRFGVSKPIGLPDFWDSWDVAQGQVYADVNGGANPRWTPEQIEKFRNGADPEPMSNGVRWQYYANTDWIDEALRDNMKQQEHSIQFSGGSKDINVLTSVGYIAEQGLLKHTDDYNKRMNFRNSTNFRITEKIKLDTRVSFVRSHRKSMPSRDGNIWFWMYEMPQEMPIYAPESFTEEVGGQARYADNGWFINPIQAQREGGVHNSYDNTIRGNVQLTIDMLPGLQLMGRSVLQYKWANSDNFNRTFERWGRGQYLGVYNNPNSVSEAEEREYFNNYYATLNYSKIFAEKHNLKLVAGISEENSEYEGFSAGRSNLINNDLPSLTLGDSETMTNNSWGSEYSIRSFFGRLNYIYADKYLAEFTIRRDASSRFYEDERWGNFPSASVGWRISEEAFMDGLTFLDNLKLRASYGELGNQNGLKIGGRFDNFGHLALLSVSGQYPFGQDASPMKAQSMYERGLPATERTWETIVNKNIGVDATLFNNRLNFTFDYFKKETEDILINIPRPTTLGISPPKTNAGEMEVKGWEAMVSYQNKIGELDYKVSFRLDDNKTEITSFRGENTPHVGSNVIEGYAYGEYFGLSVDKIAQTQSDIDDAPDHSAIHGFRFTPGDIIYKDLSGPDGVPDGKITREHDIKSMGNSNPRYNYGANIDLRWKNFDLSMFFQGVGKRDYFLTSSISQPFEWPWTKPSTQYADYWTEDNTDAKYPKMRFQNHSNYGTYNEIVKHSVSYFRLKNLRIGYHVPQDLLTKLGLGSVYIYADGTNLFTISDFDILDPEINRSSGRFYPYTKAYNLGVNINF